MDPTADISDKPLYNSRLIDTYIKLIRRRYAYIDIDELLQYANMEPYQVEDEEHWFTQEHIDLFHEKLRKLTGNKEIAREAGRYAASPDALGTMRHYALGLIGPAKAYGLIGKYASNFTRSTAYASRSIAHGKVEIAVTPNEDIHERPFQCENRMGYFEAIAMIFDRNPPGIEHPECVFTGGKSCKYIVSLEESPEAVWKKIRNALAVLLAFVFFGMAAVQPKLAFLTLLPFFALAVAAVSLYAGYLERRGYWSANENLRTTTERLLSQVNENYNTALMVNEIGMALSKKIETEEILNEVVRVLKKRLDYDRGLLLLANQERTLLQARAGFGYSDEQMRIANNTDFHLDRAQSKGIFVASFREQRPFLINDIDEIKSELTQRSMDFARRLGVKSFICCPIMYEGESLGILAVDYLKTKRPLLQRDINQLMGIAPIIGISIHNATLFYSKEEQFRSIIKALAATIDARDPLTAGHSERVSRFSVGICGEFGVQIETCEAVRIASLLHDYGKIGIKDSILKKQGRLDIEERKEIMTHPLKTREILEQIGFEGVLREVPLIASTHHERIDGSGYPYGLKGDEIPLGGRIIAVADFFEAVTSKRHYRDPMPFEFALRLLQEKSGSEFDPDVVKAFIRYSAKESGYEKLTNA
jgi:HD-GYP domain-containing protein (c-di-GMP phosphodiesterase class II)